MEQRTERKRMIISVPLHGLSRNRMDEVMESLKDSMVEYLDNYDIVFLRSTEGIYENVYKEVVDGRNIFKITIQVYGASVANSTQYYNERYYTIVRDLNLSPKDIVVLLKGDDTGMEHLSVIDTNDDYVTWKLDIPVNGLTRTMAEAHINRRREEMEQSLLIGTNNKLIITPLTDSGSVYINII